MRRGVMDGGEDRLSEWMDGWTDGRTVELRGSEFSKGRMLFGREQTTLVGWFPEVP